MKACKGALGTGKNSTFAVRSQKCLCYSSKSLNSNIKIEIFGKFKNVHGAYLLNKVWEVEREKFKSIHRIQRKELVFSKGTKWVTA